MGYMNKSINAYLKDLAAKAPSPGGGAAAALSAAMAAALISMVCRYTIGKERYKKHQRRIKEILSGSLKEQRRLSKLVDKDIKAYAAGDMDAAISVPAEVCFSSCELLAAAVELIEKGNINLLSDTLLAASLSEVSFFGGLLYVNVNAGSIKGDKTGYTRLLVKLGALAKRVIRLKKKAEVRCGYLIRR